MLTYILDDEGYVQSSAFAIDGATVAGGVTVSPPSLNSRWSGAEWVPGDRPIPTPDPAAALAVERSRMVVSRLQGRLTIGPETCAILDGMAADPETPWAMRQALMHAGEWHRTSQSMTELGYLLQYTDEQMDTLFRIAATVSV